MPGQVGRWRVGAGGPAWDLRAVFCGVGGEQASGFQLWRPGGVGAIVMSAESRTPRLRLSGAMLQWGRRGPTRARFLSLPAGRCKTEAQWGPRPSCRGAAPTPPLPVSSWKQTWLPGQRPQQRRGGRAWCVWVGGEVGAPPELPRNRAPGLLKPRAEERQERRLGSGGEAILKWALYTRPGVCRPCRERPPHPQLSWDPPPKGHSRCMWLVGAQAEGEDVNSGWQTPHPPVYC